MHETRKILVESGANVPRTYRPLRQRVRPRPEKEKERKGPSIWRTEYEEMDHGRENAAAFNDRSTLCLPDFESGSALHAGDERFRDVARTHFRSAENNATEGLVKLKSKLRNASTHDFWAILTKEMCAITGAQCGYVSKRILVDDRDSAIEMPLEGDPGLCLMAVAFYLDNGEDVPQLHRDYNYYTYGTACAHMKHDKVLIVPERLDEFIPNNPNTGVLPWKQSEAFIGVPLFSEGKNFAHFGLIWSVDGAARRNLSWGYIEMFLHSLEDIIADRILEGRGFAKEVAPEAKAAKVIPLSAITSSQSLKPYARSLSHELRTPMQGVVGLLDIMYSTIIDAMRHQQSGPNQDVFTTLKKHIETVQDSSKRAIEAADNVVYAYSNNMEMPDTPLTQFVVANDSAPTAHVPTLAIKNLGLPGRLPSPPSTKRNCDDDLQCHPGSPRKRVFTISETEILRKCYPEDEITSCGVCGVVAADTAASILSPPAQEVETIESSPKATSAILSPNHGRVVTREFIRTLLNEVLRNGHPTSEVRIETDLGETIEIQTLTSRGEVQSRNISLMIEAEVPEVIIVEESHLQFALQKVVDNAIKFTDNGSITITIKMAKYLRFFEIWVVDTGCGIAVESQPNVFKPHFQADSSTSRARDGLGLSLFNAKAHVRRNLGGDVTLEKSSTQGPSKGSTFLIRLPISTFDLINIDAPLVGTPPNRSFSMVHGLPTPEFELNIPATTPPVSVDGDKMIPFGPASRSTKIGSHKRPAFNPALATKCPLNILIAEDNAINRNVAVGSLNKLGYPKDNITVAFDGVEAVQYYQESLSKPPEQQFDAILMDIWMPNMDGFEATAKILDLAKHNGAKTKIIAVTADITGECLSNAESVGMQGFLAKPYKVLDFENLILRHFHNAK
ncbi:hypothetical protein HYFRA_00010390 [Hymenoscyphus fraxineus]|uniref:histidine kinase n=1 Tax=Hymenoscyphus fraxineus TaxID=746836 RepID=A0A9N9L126_9HELO|nr:hypothetical protein HYFRA_00010390 [Hymenoscyphus fraxineus]